MKIYRGSAAGARAYLDAERGRADDYYLGEGNGSAERLGATRDGSVESLGFLEGDAYEAWVAGIDPETGELRGRIRSDGHAVRFAEFVINGPKSWSLAAELHPDIAAAYEKAQDAAASEVVAWFAQHGVTRVGPRGGQVAVPVERIEAAVIRHYTSRAGDPHRHLHLQINARVEAAGKWRGLDTVAVRNSIAAVQGIGHAAIAADPGFRAALAEHGYTLDPVSGELEQIAPFVGVFSKRAEQIGRQVDSYERQWRSDNPCREPGPGLRRSWDARAWADARPDKQRNQVLPGPEQARHAWTEELSALGFAPPEAAVPVAAVPIGQLDRDQTAARVVARLTSQRSAWNAADLRGQAELLIVEAGIVATGAARTELAEDLTARAYAQCVPLLERAGLPEHLRAWTSRAAVEAEQDLEGRFAARGAVSGRPADLLDVADAAHGVGVRLDSGQADAVADLAGSSALIVVTGAAGAGKTTMLTTAQAMITAQEHSLLVVTPTLKAARTASRETKAEAGSAAWFAYQHGYRWNSDGAWSRLQPGDTDAVTGQIYRGPSTNAQLRAGDLLVVDEAGMLDQDTARALVRIADQHRVRVALIGDPHQLPAVGRGGVLDLAARWTSSAATLDVVHRFTTTSEIAPGIDGTVTDRDYAALSLKMRTGDDPGAVFDTLHQRGQVAVYPDEATRAAAVADHAATAWSTREGYALSADTRDTAAELSAAVQERLVCAGQVDDSTVCVTSAGERIGVGDRVATRRNDQALGVANRDLWRVDTVTDEGSLILAGEAGTATITADYAYQHLELAYASTVYGVQGDTVTAGHLVLGESTGAQAAYVGMTRGRAANTVHIVADDLAGARAQWIAAAGRNRADLGLRTARDQAQQSVSQYATPEMIAEQRAALAHRLHSAWDQRTQLQAQVREYTAEIAQARRHATWVNDDHDRLTQQQAAADQSRQRAEQLAPAAEQARQAIENRARQIQASLTSAWERDQPALREALSMYWTPEPAGAMARVTGKTNRHQTRKQQADAVIKAWERTWGNLPKRTTDPSYHLRPHAERLAREQLPDAVEAISHADTARELARETAKAYREAKDLYEIRNLLDLQQPRRYRVRVLSECEADLQQAQKRLDSVNEQFKALTKHPIATENWITEQHQQWSQERERVARERAHEQARQAFHTRNESLSADTGYRAPGTGRDHDYGIGD